MDNLRLGKFPNNEGGSCLQDVVIEVNRMSKEQASLPSKILTNIQPAQLEALKKDKVGLDLTFDVGATEDKTQIYLDGATQDTAGILTAEDKKVIDSVADLKLGYNEETRMIQLNNGTELVSEIPADRFIKDGMVNGVSIDEETKVVTITFNTDAGQEDIPVDFGDIYDLLLGEAKSYVDNKIFLQVGLENGEYPGGQIAYIQHPNTSTIRLIPTWKDHFNSFIFNENGEIEFNDGNGPNSSSIITIKNTDKVNNSYNLKDYLDLKANQATTYTKEEINNLLASNSNVAIVNLTAYGEAQPNNKTAYDKIVANPNSLIIVTINNDINYLVCNYTIVDNLIISYLYSVPYSNKGQIDIELARIQIDSSGNTTLIQSKVITYEKQKIDSFLSIIDSTLSSKADSATTLVGYGITDAKIENGTITLGSNFIEIPESPIVLTISFTANESNAAAYTKLLSDLTIPTYIVDNNTYYHSVLNSVINSTTIRVFVIVNAATSNPSIREYQLYSNGSLIQSLDTVLITSNQLKSTLTYTTEANADNVTVWSNLTNGYITTVKIEDPQYTYTLCIDEINGTSLRATSWNQNDTLIKIVYTVNASTGAMTKTSTNYQLTPVTI